MLQIVTLLEYLDRRFLRSSRSKKALLLLTLLVACWRNLADSIRPDSCLVDSNDVGIDRLDDIIDAKALRMIGSDRSLGFCIDAVLLRRNQIGKQTTARLVVPVLYLLGAEYF